MLQLYLQNEMTFITSYCHINSSECTINGKPIIQNGQNQSWLKELYQFVGVDYPKFYKMDRLAQLAFIGTELLIKDNSNIQEYKDDEIALLFSNRTSSLDTDLKYEKSYQAGNSPSPSLFVYTLPNILIGEICIKNKWYGESIFTVSPFFNTQFFNDYISVLLNENSKACLCGWIEVSGDKLEAFFFFVEKTDTKRLNLPLSMKNIEQLFQL